MKSSNIGMITVSETMGFERQYHYMGRSGWARRPRSSFPARTRGSSTRGDVGGDREVHRRLQPGWPAARSSSSSAVNVIANDGVYVAPSWSWAASTPEATDGDAALPDREVVRPGVAGQMQRIMRGGVSGTASRPRSRPLRRRQDGDRVHRPARRRLRRRERQAERTPPASSASPAEDPQVTVLVFDRPTAD